MIMKIGIFERLKDKDFINGYKMIIIWFQPAKRKNYKTNTP